MTDTPILDLLVNREKLRARLVETARREVRRHVADQTLKNVLAPRVDEILGRARRR